MIEITVYETAEITPAVRAQVHRLFDLTYDQADHEYLDKSLSVLRYIAFATPAEYTQVEYIQAKYIPAKATPAKADDGHQSTPVDDPRQDICQSIGFAIGETRRLDLPGIPGQQVGLAGLCCVDPRYRRRGIFQKLERSVIKEGMGELSNGRILAAGRMAHPASFRIMASNPTVVPRPNVIPTKFQQQVGQIVAGSYKVSDFDPLTFVCKGNGHPIGYPRMTVEVEPEEWDVFVSVDRANGDSLLALSWIPNAPRRWENENPL